MLSRYKGCLVGALVGDCFGAFYEGNSIVKTRDVTERLQKIYKKKKESHDSSSKHMMYTDDTAMTHSVALSLIQMGRFDPLDMGKRFAEKFFKEPNRGYGASIHYVFERLKNADAQNVYSAAQEQFDGTGSCGNGGAMRIAPAPLFAFPENDACKLQELVASITKLTHAHHLGVHGAILVAHAIDQSLRINSDADVVDTNHFIDELVRKMKPLEEEYISTTPREPPSKRAFKRELDSEKTPYCAKLLRIKEMLQDQSLKKSTVVSELGNDVLALSSVPAAILSFLKATQNIPKLEKELNKFEQSIVYAISLGGDTDTVATMTGAMAGALYGVEKIPEALRLSCESVNKVEKMAEDLYNLHHS